MKFWRLIIILILLITMTFKLISIFNPVPLLKAEDAVFGVPILYVVITATATELAVCLILVLCNDMQTLAGSVMAFSLMALSYRGIAAMSGVTHCPCLGNIVGWWPWLGRHEDSILKTILFWMLITSVVKLITRQPQSRINNSKKCVT